MEQEFETPEVDIIKTDAASAVVSSDACSEPNMMIEREF